MQVTIMHVHVRDAHIEDFIQATAENHRESILEAGNLRFDVLRSADDPSRFLLYEAWTREDAIHNQKATSHYLDWRATVAPWMASDRQGISYHGLYPQGESM